MSSRGFVPFGGTGNIVTLDNINEFADLPAIEEVDSPDVYEIRTGELATDYLVPVQVDSTSFTDWYSLLDGQVLRAIPDPDIYLQDDWGDNKLTDREDSGTTTYNGVEGVYRPEWTTEQGNPVAEDERLKMDTDTISTGINLNLDETVTWEVTIRQFSDDGNDSFAIGLFSETTTIVNSGRMADDGYVIFFSPEDTVDIRRVDDGNDTTLISGGNVPEDEDYSVSVTRTPSGEFELFDEDSSLGTDTDTTYDDDEEIEAIAIGGRDTDNPDFEVHEYKAS